MKIWLIILIAGLISWVLRITPLFISKLSFSRHPTFLAALDYAACAAVGCMIYMAVFGQFTFSDFSLQNYILFAVNIGILLFAFSLSLYQRKPVITFIICFSLYALIILLIHTFK
jgi:branched-subunit amino acid transport protein